MTSAPWRERKPDWIKVRFPAGENFHRVKALVRKHNLHTVCEEAHCPNIGECFGRGTATFMILGETCTRACGFCAVTSGRPSGLDEAEPERLAASVRILGLRYVVITSVNRDDLPDGGAHIFARCLERIREDAPDVAV
ncbi:MAG TPA: radical SAM protein, partial [Dehalococcoidia bacterium]|nr:radical SAM protein [Dehalococcoidia bacterium]